MSNLTYLDKMFKGVMNSQSIKFTFRKGDYLIADCNEEFKSKEDFIEFLQAVFIEGNNKGVPITVNTRFGSVKCEPVPENFRKFLKFIVGKLIWSNRVCLQYKEDDREVIQNNINFLATCCDVDTEVKIILDEYEILFKTNELVNIEKIIIGCAAKVKHHFGKGVHNLNIFLAGHNEVSHEFIDLESFLNVLTDIICFFNCKEDTIYQDIVNGEVPNHIRDLFK